MAQAQSSMKYRKATRYHDLAKAREEVARLFPLAMATIEGILRHKKAPRNLRFEAAKLIYYQQLGRPPAMLDIELQGEVLNLSHADHIARAAAEARRAFKEALEKADGLSKLDEFAAPSDSPPGRPDAADGQAGAS